MPDAAWHYFCSHFTQAARETFSRVGLQPHVLRSTNP